MHENVYPATVGYGKFKSVGPRPRQDILAHNMIIATADYYTTEAVAVDTAEFEASAIMDYHLIKTVAGHNTVGTTGCSRL